MTFVFAGTTVIGALVAMNFWAAIRHHERTLNWIGKHHPDILTAATRKSRW